MPSIVMTVPPAPSAEALAHFEDLLRFETDCWDVREAMAGGDPDFVLLDVRSPAQHGRGHVPGAVNLPRRAISEAALAAFPRSAAFVVYCDGPHCNGAQRAAIRLAQLGRPVKLMLGGVAGWLDEGFPLERGEGARRRFTSPHRPSGTRR